MIHLLFLGLWKPLSMLGWTGRIWGVDLAPFVRVAKSHLKDCHKWLISYLLEEALREEGEYLVEFGGRGGLHGNHNSLRAITFSQGSKIKINLCHCVPHVYISNLFVCPFILWYTSTLQLYTSSFRSFHIVSLGSSLLSIKPKICEQKKNIFKKCSCPLG
jgi:hypothetical protein